MLNAQRAIGRGVLTLAVGGTAIASLAGCGAGIGADGPEPGIAARVGDHTITIDELETVTDVQCAVTAANPQARATSRQVISTSLLNVWVVARVALENGAQLAPAGGDYTTIPGWDDLDEEGQEDLTTFIKSTAVQVQEGEVIDTSDLDISVNPRYGLAVGDELTVGDEPSFTDLGLSVPVSDDAQRDGTAYELSDEQLAALPDSELCGKRPTAPAGMPLS